MLPRTFGLLQTSLRSVLLIRVVKNLQVCNDSNIVTKFIFETVAQYGCEDRN